MENHILNVKTIVESMGKRVLDIDFYDHIYEWLEWYEGSPDSFRLFNQYNGHEWVQRERYTLNMPKLIAEDWATLLYNDRTAIKVDENKQKELDGILEDNKFAERFSDFIEIVMALGSGALVEYKDSKGNPKINYIIAPMIFPLRVENGEIVDCAFASVQNDSRYYINIHEKQDNGSYVITNKYFTFNDGKAVDNGSGKLKEKTTSKVKLFQIFKPCIKNNIDVFSPFGISVYANALDRVKACDLVYDSLRNEFVLGKKRLFLSEDIVDYKPVVRADGTSINVPTFDNNDVEFYSISTGEGSSEQQIREINPTLRTSEHINSLQSALNMLSDACGLGNDRYNFQSGNVYTNTTQVISSQSKLYKTLLKHEKVLRAGMIDMIRALFYLKANKEYKSDITIDFDDSIIEDTASIQQRAMIELQSGIIDAVEYIVQVYKYTEDQAIDFIDSIRERVKKQQLEDAPEEPTPETPEEYEETEEAEEQPIPEEEQPEEEMNAE